MNRIESKTQVTTTTEVDCSLNETYSLSFKDRKDDKGEISFISNGSILDEYGKTVGTIKFTNYGSKELTVTAPLDVVGVVTPLIVDAINQVNNGNATEVKSFSRVFKSHKASTNEEPTEEVIPTLPPTNELSENAMKDIMGLPHEPDGGEETVFENAESESEPAETEDSVESESETDETEDSAN